MNPASNPLRLLSVVLPARDEEGCIASTVQHLSVELRLQGVPHEIVVVDDGSSDRTWEILQELQQNLPELKPVQNTGEHGFGRAIQWGLDQMTGDAVVIMMADESDDCRDVVRYWRKLNEGFDCVFGSRFVQGRGSDRLPAGEDGLESPRELLRPRAFSLPLKRHHQRLQSLSPDSDRWLAAAHLAALQHHPRAPVESNRARLFLDRHPHHLAQPAHRRSEVKDQGNGEPLPFHLPLSLAGEVSQPRRLSGARFSPRSERDAESRHAQLLDRLPDNALD